MRTNLQEVGPLGRKLKIEIPKDIVNSAYENTYRNVQKTTTLKGFRPGKAPLDRIKQLYQPQIIQEVAEKLIQHHYSQALAQEKVSPLTYPEFEFDVPKENEDFSFTASFEIRPEVQIKKLTGIEIEVETQIASDEERLNRVLENMRTSSPTYAPVLEDRAAIDQDFATIDFDGKIDGAPLEGGSAQGYRIQIGSHSMIDGFEEGLIGLKPGQSKQLQLKFPDPYTSNPALSGKPVEFKVTLHKIEKQVLPELNDEFAKLVKKETLAELKADIEKSFAESDAKERDAAVKEKILQQIVEQNPVAVPETFLTEQKKLLVEDLHKRFHDEGHTHEQYEEYLKKWDDDITSNAKKIIQASFLVQEIARQNNLQTTDEHVEARLLEYAKTTNLDLAKIQDFYSKEDRLDRLRSQLTEERVIEFLRPQVKIKEVAAPADATRK